MIFAAAAALDSGLVQIILGGFLMIGGIVGGIVTVLVAKINRKQEVVSQQVKEVKDVADASHDAINSHALIEFDLYQKVTERVAALTEGTVQGPADRAIADAAKKNYDDHFKAAEEAKVEALKIAAAKASGVVPIAKPVAPGYSGA